MNEIESRSILPRATAGFAFTDLSTPAGLSREQARRFASEQVGAVLRNTPYMMLANMLAATWLVWAAWGSEIGSGILAWAAAMFLVSGILLGRSMMRRSGKRAPAVPRGQDRVLQRAEVFAVLLGLLWAALPALFMPASPPDMRMLIMGVVMGASGMGAFSLSRIPAAATIYALMLSGALAMACAQTGGEASVAAFGLASVYGIGLAAMIISAHRNAIRRTEDGERLDRQNEIIKLLLRDFQAGASDWLWETDREGRLVYVSERLSQVAGRSEQRLLGASLPQAAGVREDEAGWCALLARMDRHEVLSDVQLAALGGDARTWWELSARPLFDGAGRFKGYRGVGRDVTARREAEMELIAAKEAAERADAAKSQFLAIVSHELRTPLNAIGGFAELISSRFRDNPGNDPAVEYARNISDSTAHLSTLINDILDVTRIERGDVALVEQELDPQELCEIVAKICRTQAEPKSNTLVETYPATTYEVAGDLTRMKQILINLVSNAVKFTPEGGRVDLGFAVTPAGGLEFAVGDTGIGIDQSKLALIFEPFVQADQGHGRQFGGVGLGLSIARKLARLHGGEIVIESMPGAGTTARFTLPAARVREFRRRQTGNRTAAA